MKLDIKYSYFILCYLLLIHVLALLSVMVLPIVVSAKLILVGLLLLSFCFYYRRHIRQTLSVLEKNAEDEWFLSYADGRRYHPLQLVRAYVNHYVIILVLKQEDSHFTQSILLTTGMARPEQLRQLRVYLRTIKTWDQ